MSDPIVHIIDDDDAVRDSLCFLLAAAGRQTIAYASATEFLSKVDAAPHGCIVTDVRMPDMSGLDLIAALNARPGFAMPIIVITGHGDVTMAVEAMKAGAADFLEKPFEEDVLLAAVNAVLTAQTASDRKGADRAAAAQKIATLSGRELEVLQGLVAGRANKVIAQDLGISPRTVEIYRANVMTKMGANSLSDLVRFALLADLGA